MLRLPYIGKCHTHCHSTFAINNWIPSYQVNLIPLYTNCCQKNGQTNCWCKRCSAIKYTRSVNYCHCDFGYMCNCKCDCDCESDVESDPEPKIKIKPQSKPEIKIMPEPTPKPKPECEPFHSIPQPKPKPKVEEKNEAPKLTTKSRQKSAYINRNIYAHDSSTIAYRLIPRPDFSKK